jgi:thiol-disulfide isomerase/thioredoxin
MSTFKVNKGLFAILAAVLAVAGVSTFLGYKLLSQKTPVELYVFDTCGGCNVQNPCKPCSLFLELINKYRWVFVENGLRDKVELKPYNIYLDNDAAAYRQNLAVIGLEEAPSLPAVVVGGKLISGTGALDEKLVAAIKAERRFAPLLKQLLGIKKSEKTRIGLYDERTIVNFSLPYCEDCKKTDVFLENLEGVTVVRIDPSDAAGRALYEKYCETYGVPLNDYAAPRLFIQKSSFLGYQEAAKALEEVLAGNSKTIKIELE